MPCPECYRPLSHKTLCCTECKEKLKHQLGNLRTYCSSNNIGYVHNNIGYVHLAFGLIKDDPVFIRAVKVYGNSVCGNGIFKTVARLYQFILEALDDYDFDYNNWDEFLYFYQANGCNLIDFVENHL